MAGFSAGGLLGGLSGLAGGIVNLNAANQASASMGNIIDQANSFGPLRGMFAGMLQHLMQNPSDVSNMPGYEAGMQAIERSGAAHGQGIGSGALETSLFKYGGDMFNQWTNQLANWAGANINPATLLQGEQQRAQTKASGVGGLLSGVGGLISSIF